MSGRSEQRLTKRQQRLAERGVKSEKVEKFPTISQLNFNLRHITPMTENQALALESYENGNNSCLLGCAGTGKTFLSIYNAMRSVEDKNSPQRRLVIIRSAQASKNVGFLPGTLEQKIEVYEAPYKAIFAELYGRDDAYEVLKHKGLVKFDSTSFLRGTTIDQAVVLFDEIQNANYIEARTVLTRIGMDSRIIMCGDANQDDLTSKRYSETSSLATLVSVFNKMNIDSFNFGVEDIVRSGFVKDFIIAEYELGLY